MSDLATVKYKSAWVNLDGGEYMTTQEVADMLGVVRHNVQQILSRHNLNSITLSDKHLQSLKELGVVPLKTPTVNVLPRPSIDKIVHKFDCVGPDYEHLKQLKELVVIAFKTTVVNLLPRETVNKIIKIVGTKEAHEIWNQLINEGEMK